MDATGARTRHRICPFCEACCGLELTIVEGRVSGLRGHDADVFSAGYICPKGVAIKQLHEDPDRLRQPLLKRDGRSTCRRLGRGACSPPPPPSETTGN